MLKIDTITYMISNFSKRLKELREEKNLSQRKLAVETNITQANISRWEADLQDPSTEGLITLAKFFNVTTDYLLGITNE